MKNGVIKRLTPLILTVFPLCALTGCEMEIQPYNATLYEAGKWYEACKWIDLDFQKENLTRGFWDLLYFNDESIITDESYPKERIFIINDRAEFDTIFNEFPPGVNFEKEMILLYGFTTTTPRQLVIKRIKLENKRLNIELKWRVPPGGPMPDGMLPQMRWFVIKIDKLDIDTVNFIWKK